MAWVAGIRREVGVQFGGLTSNFKRWAEDCAGYCNFGTRRRGGEGKSVEGGECVFIIPDKPGAV